MKKLWLLIVLIMAAGMLSACGGSRTALDAAGFIEKAEAAGYTALDQTEAAIEAGTGYTTYVTARNTTGDTPYAFEFVILETAQEAKELFQTVQGTIEGSKGQTSSHSAVSTGSYEYYTLVSNGQYSAISRVGSTLIYTFAPGESKAEVDAFLKTIGY